MTYDNNGNWSNLFQSENNKVEEILGINSENITNMYNAFFNLHISKIPLCDTSSVTDMSNMFSSCKSLTSVPEFDTSKVTTMANMFSSCTSLTTVPSFDTSSVTNMSGMFAGCESLTTVPLFDTSNVTNMYAMFQGCTSLESVPLFNTSNVTSMSYMFDMCKSNSDWSVSKLESVPLFNTSSVAYMTAMFRWCGHLKNIPVFADVSQVKNVWNIFNECRNVESGILSIYNKFSVLGLTSDKYAGAFYNCGLRTQTGQDELAQIPSDWK